MADATQQPVSLTTLRFEELREERIPQILEIERKVNSAPWSERSFRNELNHKHGIFITALLEGQVVGYGGVWMVIDEAHITTVAVADSHWRLGIGRRLMIDLLRRSKEAGMVCSTLEVRASNAPAIALYEMLGFKIEARRKHYYPDNHEDAVVMWLDDMQTWEPPRR